MRNLNDYEVDRYRIRDPRRLAWVNGWAGDETCGAFNVRSERGGNYMKVIASSGEELWKPIKGWEELYQVSTSGRVQALAKDVPLPYGGARHHETMILAWDRSMDYPRVKLCRDGEKKNMLVHRLVADAFIPNPQDYPEVNHRDGVFDNPHVINLEWCSPEYNKYHAIEIGLRDGQLPATRPPEPTRYPGPDMFWDHVSVSLEKRPPTWYEMEQIKRLFFRSDETAMQLHVPPSQHINIHPNCLHLWSPHGRRIPLPPSWMVGPQTKERNHGTHEGKPEPTTDAGENGRAESQERAAQGAEGGGPVQGQRHGE